jgi:Carbohydrate esterase, sialic acid-specific acetylesterase/Concanavalin A-like lectin/glucanases superfamily
MKLQIKAGTADYTLQVFIQDSSDTTGAGLAGLDDTKVDAYYSRVETDNDVVKADIGIADLSAITDAHSEGGFVEIDATNLPGWYRLDLPDAVLAAGAWSAAVRIYDAGANDVADCTLEIQLTGADVAPDDFTTTQKASINTEADAALSDINLDHWMKTAADSDDITNVVTDQSALACLLAADGDISAYNDNNHSLEAIRARGDAEWPTATGFATSGALSTHDGKLDTVDAIADKLLQAHVLVATTIASDGRSTTTCRLTAGSDNDDAYIGMQVILDDDDGDGEYVSRTITDYDGGDKELTWSPAITESAEDGGTVYIVPGDTAIAPAVAAAHTTTDGKIDVVDGIVDDLLACKGMNLNRGLRGFWPLSDISRQGGTAWDHSGNGLLPSNTIATGVSTTEDYGVFSGANYLAFPKWMFPQMFSDPFFTWFGQVRMTSDLVNEQMLGQWGDTGSFSWKLSTNASSKLQFAVSSDGGSGGLVAVADAQELSLNVWYDVMVWIDGADAHIRVNAVETSDTFASTPYYTSAYHMYIGNTFSGKVTGNMKNFIWWDRPLTLSERDAVFDSWRPTSKLGGPINVGLLLGQSNGGGYADTTDLLPDEDAWWFNVPCMDTTEGDSNDQFRPSCSGHQQASSQVARFGPILGMAEVLERDNWAWFVHGPGGTSLNVGESEWEDGGATFNTATANIALALQDLEAAGYQPHIRVLCWQQGEADAEAEALAEVWAEDAAVLFTALRALYGPIPIVFGSCHTSQDFTYIDTVIAQQEALALTLENSYFIDLSGWGEFGLEPDGYHFDMTTQVLLGRAYAGAIKVMTGEGDLRIEDVPTTAEFEARTLAAADYVVVTDTIAGVTLVTTCTTNSDMVAAAPTAEQNADALLVRDVSNVEDTAALHSLAGVILGATEWSRSTTTLTIYKTDGESTFDTLTLTQDADSVAITGATE